MVLLLSAGLSVDVFGACVCLGVSGSLVCAGTFGVAVGFGASVEFGVAVGFGTSVEFGVEVGFGVAEESGVSTDGVSGSAVFSLLTIAIQVTCVSSSAVATIME